MLLLVLGGLAIRKVLRALVAVRASQEQEKQQHRRRKRRTAKGSRQPFEALPPSAGLALIVADGGDAGEVLAVDILADSPVENVNEPGCVDKDTSEVAPKVAFRAASLEPAPRPDGDEDGVNEPDRPRQLDADREDAPPPEEEVVVV